MEGGATGGVGPPRIGGPGGCTPAGVQVAEPPLGGLGAKPPEAEA